MKKDYKKLFLKQLECLKKQKIVFWGASLFLKDFIKKTSLEEFNIIGIVDKNQKLWGKKYGNYEIFNPDKINELSPDYIVISIKNIKYDDSILLENFIQAKCPKTKVLSNVLVRKPNPGLKSKLKEIFDIKINCKITEIKQELSVQFKELESAAIFNNLINITEWIEKKDFIPTGGAASYTFLYNLFAILEYIQPENILEFGLGQTTKLTSSYVKNKNQKASLQVLEQDKIWLEYFSKQISDHKNVTLYLKESEHTFINDTANHKYADLSDVISNKKYDLIIIDGPIAGNDYYPRTNILDLIPQNLAQDFIIILDDAARDGEKRTAKLLFDKLAENNIEYIKFYKIASRTQLFITSSKYKFIKFY